MGTEQAIILMLIGVIMLLCLFLFTVWNKVDSIQNNCNFDITAQKVLDSKLEALMNDVRQHIHGDSDGLNILVFDDEKDSAWQIREKILTVAPETNVMTANNMDRALYCLSTGNLDVVFSDQRHHTEEYGTILFEIMKVQKIEAKFILYSAGKKPEKYDGPFLDKFEIMKNPDMLKEYL